MTTATATCLFDNIIEFSSLTQEGGKSNEWYTPARYIEAAREVMGGIDLDPASCAMANNIVRAKRYYTQHDNGLAYEWHGRVWLNPPFGKTNNQSNIGLFIRKLIREYQSGNIEQAILLVTPKNTCAWYQPLWDYPICFADHHVQFHRPDGKMKDQMFGVVFAYLGPNEQKFIEVFSQFGTIAKRVSPPVVKPVNLSLWEEV